MHEKGDNSSTESATEYVATVSVGHVGATHSPLLAHPYQMHQQPNPSHKTAASNSHLTNYPSHNIVVLQAPIRTSILCNKNHNKEPERSDPTPAKHTHNRSQASYRKITDNYRSSRPGATLNQTSD
ncbi:hypothetical protein F511_33010 [Dorcoceras hygrometricum]|uniref:Uncharacterized protein n=1 Tax=Dorcoceras hygrometricum TaxID=472368 RepID=A0A2Z7CJS8_9LAMI|nr:hypothetical protein F511_33010 [Dorcoceras hygrometricum]